MTARGPLGGVRLVSLAQNVPGPVAVARLAAEGATASKVEPPGGDPLEGMCPSWYADLHREVQVTRLDLKSSAGLDALHAHLHDADVLLTSHRPGALARLGLDAPTWRTRHPHLRHVAILGDTARPDMPGHDLTYQATAGLLGREMPVTLLADLAGAERACTAVLLVLHEPEGSVRQVGLADSLEALAAPRRHGLTAPGGLLGGGLAAYGIYDSLDGRVAVAALEPHFRTRLYTALGLPADAPLAEVMRGRTGADWEAWARAHDLPLAVVRPL
jgi:alpha-methylacyl-CoA racemase